MTTSASYYSTAQSVKSTLSLISTCHYSLLCHSLALIHAAHTHIILISSFTIVSHSPFYFGNTIGLSSKLLAPFTTLLVEEPGILLENKYTAPKMSVAPIVN